jgi:uncharacterized protein DUF4339
MEPQWYYTLKGQQVGPVPESQLRTLLQGGQVPVDEFVFKEGMTDWLVASSCAELSAASPQKPGGPPPPPASKAILTPRAGVGELSIESIYREAFEIFKASWLPLGLGFLLIFAISFGGGLITGVISAIVKDRQGLLTHLLGLVINGPLTYGMWLLALNAVDRKPVSPMDVLEGFKHFVPALVLNLLFTIAVILGLFVLFIGAIAVAIFLGFVWPYLIDQKCSPIDAIKKSFECVKSNFVIVLVLYLLCIPIMIAGLLALIIGLIPATIFAILTIAVAYRWLNPQTPAV